MVRAEKPKTDSTNLVNALDYLARGWAALPLCPWDHQGVGDGHRAACKRPGKCPLVKDWQQRKLTEAELRSAWQKCPRANVGIALGPLSGLVGLDIDGPVGGTLLRALEEACSGNNPLPKTLAFSTGGGGHRFLFALPPGADPPQKVWRDAQGKEALRFQARGGQTVMPFSIHPSGERYRWWEGHRPGEVDLATCPPWLLQLAAAPDAPASPAPPAPPPDEPVLLRAIAYLEKCEPAISGQGGHDHTFKVCCKLVRGFGLNLDTALMLLKDHWNDRCRPPWSDKELRHKLDDALNKGTDPVGELRDAPRRNGPSPARPPRPPLVEGIAPPAEHKAPTVQTFTAADLVATQFAPMRWAVPGLFPEGCVLLAGRPKGGKSWLVLQIALAIARGSKALGKLDVEPGEALYCALEDGPRRLRSRLLKLLGDQEEAPAGLHLATSWPKGPAAVDALADWLAKHPNARLAVLDTLARVRDRRGDAQSLYDSDYDAIAAYKDLGDRTRSSVAIIHHTRKPKEQEEDPFDSISGTLGLGGAADAICVLKKAVGALDAKLHVTGRDIEEQTLPLSWSPDDCLWSLAEVRDGLTPEQRRVVEALRTAGCPLSPLEAAPLLGKNYEAAKKLLKRMADEGVILGRGGKYSAFTPSADVPRVPGGATAIPD